MAVGEEAKGDDSNFALACASSIALRLLGGTYIEAEGALEVN